MCLFPLAHEIIMHIEMFFHVLDRVFNSTTDQKIDLRRRTITVRIIQESSESFRNGMYIVIRISAKKRYEKKNSNNIYI